VCIAHRCCSGQGCMVLRVRCGWCRTVRRGHFRWPGRLMHLVARKGGATARSGRPRTSLCLPLMSAQAGEGIWYSCQRAMTMVASSTVSLAWRQKQSSGKEKGALGTATKGSSRSDLLNSWWHSSIGARLCPIEAVSSSTEHMQHHSWSCDFLRSSGRGPHRRAGPSDVK
jgi:hypothetical protein